MAHLHDPSHSGSKFFLADEDDADLNTLAERLKSQQETLAHVSYLFLNVSEWSDVAGDHDDCK